MNIETKEQLRKMNLWGMWRAFTTSLESEQPTTLTADEMIAFLVQSEWDDRQNRKIERQVKNAKFRYNASIEQVIYDKDRNIDKNQIMRYCDCTFIENKENLFITGSTGIGKSYMASAIGNQACIRGFKVLYANTEKLMSKLKMAKADGTYLREITKIEKQDLLILDDFGIQPFDNQSRSYLMEIIEDRHGKRSTIITSQVPIKLWHEVIGEKTIADAILDRIVHNAHRLEMEGESMRKNISKKSSIENHLNKKNKLTEI
jgi:DNA replication protein DnaC